MSYSVLAGLLPGWPTRRRAQGATGPAPRGHRSCHRGLPGVSRRREQRQQRGQRGQQRQQPPPQPRPSPQLPQRPRNAAQLGAPACRLFNLAAGLTAKSRAFPPACLSCRCRTGPHPELSLPGGLCGWGFPPAAAAAGRPRAQGVRAGEQHVARGESPRARHEKAPTRKSPDVRARRRGDGSEGAAASPRRPPPLPGRPAEPSPVRLRCCPERALGHCDSCPGQWSWHRA